MKSSAAFVLGVSLLANAGMVTALALKPELAPASLGRVLGSSEPPGASPVPEPAPASETPKPSGGSVAKVSEVKGWAALDTADLPELAKRLRAAGFPPDVVRGILSAKIEDRFVERYRALFAKRESADYWKPRTYSAELMAEQRAIGRERGNLLRQALGEEGVAADREISSSQRQRYGNLSQGKVDVVRMIEQDYEEMTEQLRASFQNVVLPEDREKLALLEREKRADLAGLLTPEELADYEMRNSRITSAQRPALTLMNASEAEFRAIYTALQSQLDVLYPGAVGMMSSPEMFEQRRKAEETAREAIRAALGESRYQEYMRAGDREYQQMYQAAHNSGLGAEAANQAYALRDTIAKESQRIAAADDTTLEQKREALKALSEHAQTQFRTLLGTDGGKFVASARWLQAMQNGAAITIQPGGGVSVRTLRPAMPPRPSSPPPSP